MSAVRGVAARARSRVDAETLWFVVAMVAAVVPVVVAAAVALSDGWTASGDNAYVLVRARDVGTGHTPLLGMWTSSSHALGFDVNNPGPSTFYLLALPVKLWESAGIVVGMAAINVAAVLSVGWVLRRCAGTLVAVLGLLAVSALGWTMGKPLLVDPWPAHSMLVVAFALLVLAWATAAGDRWMLPWTAVAATLVVHSHLSHAYVVAAVSVVAATGLVLRTLRLGADGTTARGARDEASVLERLGPLRSPALTTAGVLAVMWLPSLVEQLGASGSGNLARLVDAARSDAATVGLTSGVRHAAEVLAVWPTWARPSFEVGAVGTPVGLPVAVLALGVLVSLVGAVGWWAWRRRDGFSVAGLALAATVVLAGTYTVAGVIETDFGTLGHHFRSLWPVAVFVQLTLVVGVVRALGERARRATLVVAGVLVVVVAAANLPHSARPPDGAQVTAVAPAIRTLHAGLAEVEGRGTVLVDFERRPFGEPFSAPLLAELARRGVDVVVADPGEIRQLGEGRSAEGRAVDEVLVMRWGREALLEAPDGELVVLASVLDDDELGTWRRLREDLLEAVGGDRPDAVAVVDGVALLRAAEEGSLSLEGVPRSEVEEWLRLDEQVRQATVGVWLVPTAPR